MCYLFKNFKNETEDIVKLLDNSDIVLGAENWLAAMGFKMLRHLQRLGHVKRFLRLYLVVVKHRVREVVNLDCLTLTVKT